MDYYSLFLVVVALLWTCFYFTKLNRMSSSKSPKYPPGPNGLPVIGNLHQLGERPHRTLAELAKSYGPLMSLKFGSITTVVVSSSEVAKEMFQKHDLAVSSRTVPAAIRANDHDMYSITWLPVTPKWRFLRKISTIQLFSSQQLDARHSLRQAKVAQLLDYVKDCSRTGDSIDIGKAAFTTSLNFLSNTFFSMDMGSYTSSFSGEFKDLVWNIMEEIGKPNFTDCFPFLGFLEKFSVNRELMAYGNKLSTYFDDIINKRLAAYPPETRGNGDVLDILIQLMKEENSELSLEDINHLLLDFFTAGTDTTSSTVEWAMTELMQNPQKMAKAQAELESVLGKDAKMVQESDIPKLPYLQAIVKETLRMHPPTVFLLPRKADSDVDLHGYLVPKNSQVFVNLWAINYDPSTWENPTSFSPERFIEHHVEMNGQNFGLIPFGAGRRICPGMTLAYRMLNLMLGTLIHGFNWKLEDGLSLKDLDMNDKFGVTITKAESLPDYSGPKVKNVCQIRY